MRVLRVYCPSTIRALSRLFCAVDDKARVDTKRGSTMPTSRCPLLITEAGPRPKSLLIHYGPPVAAARYPLPSAHRSMHLAHRLRLFQDHPLQTRHMHISYRPLIQYEYSLYSAKFVLTDFSAGTFRLR